MSVAVPNTHPEGINNLNRDDAETVSLAAAEQRYRRAKARIGSAQQERLDAEAEFLSARAVLRRLLEEVWPDPAD